MAESKFTEIMTLEEVNNGAINDLFNREYPNLLNNLGDENTSWKVQREITIKLKIKLTSETREAAISTVDVSLKTAPPKPHEQIISLDSDGSNITAYARKEAEQLELKEENVTEFKKEEVI
jgi:hypothetical protein